MTATDTDEAVKGIVEDIEAAMAEVQLSHKAACLAMEIDPARWSRMRSGELTLDARRLAMLGDDFQRAFAARRAARVGLMLAGPSEDAEAAERLRRLIHALADCAHLLMAKASLDEVKPVRRSA